MFADSMLDLHWDNRGRRGWMTLASFGLQAIVAGVVVWLPLLYTEGLPKPHLISLGAPIGAPPGQRTPAAQHPSSGRPRNILSNLFTAPQETPSGIHDDAHIPEPNWDACLDCIPGPTGTPGLHNWIIDSIGRDAVVAPPPPKPVARPPRISRMMEGNLIYRVQPVYPPMARSARIQGPVVLKAIISKSGGIEKLQVLTGHPLLVKAAIEAVSQWQYWPYILNDEPVEVETQITVNFLLSGD